MFYAMYVHSTKAEPYAELIASGAKTIETRTRDSLRQLVGHRVGIIRTRAGHPAELIGAVRITTSYRTSRDQYEDRRDRTLIPVGSKYDPKGLDGKLCYELADAVQTEPVPLSELMVQSKCRSYAIILRAYGTFHADAYDRFAKEARL